MHTADISLLFLCRLIMDLFLSPSLTKKRVTVELSVTVKASTHGQIPSQQIFSSVRRCWDEVKRTPCQSALKGTGHFIKLRHPAPPHWRHFYSGDSFSLCHHSSFCSPGRLQSNLCCFKIVFPSVLFVSIPQYLKKNLGDIAQ